MSAFTAPKRHRALTSTFSLIATLILAVANRGKAAIPESYAVTPLNMGYPAAVNSAGQVAGYTAGRAYLFSDGSLTSLGVLPGSNQSFGNGINDSGVVVGRTDDGLGRAFVYQNGSMTNLGVLPGGNRSGATGISNLGHIVGFSDIAAGFSPHAFLYVGGTMTDLGVLPGFSMSEAFGVNDAGVVVGWSHSGRSTSRAFVYRNGVMEELGSLGGPHTAARAVNNTGDIVGGAYPVGALNYHAFLYHQGVMNDLGTLGGTHSVANSINNGGDVVGQSTIDGGGIRPFIYSGGEMRDLATLVPVQYRNTLLAATSINNAGQIAVVSADGKGYLLTPVPEPGMAAALLPFCALFRRRPSRSRECQ